MGGQRKAYGEKKTWWWNEKVSKEISEKRRLWKLWKASGSKDKYLNAKRKARHAVYTAKRNAEKEKFASVKNNKGNIFCVAKQMRTENQDAIGAKCIRGDDGNLFLDDASKKLAWKQHYERLLNIEVSLSQNLPYADLVAVPVQFITPYEIFEAHEEWESGRTFWCCCRNVERCPLWLLQIIADLMNAIILEGKVPADWSDSIIVSLFKGKGDALDWSNYRGLKLTDHVLRLLKEWPKKSYVTQLTLMKCSLASARSRYNKCNLLFLDSFKRIISQNAGNCIWYLLIWKRPSIECLERYCGGLFVSLMYWNGYLK